MVLICHCTVGVGVPEAEAKKATGSPAIRVRLCGWVTIAGAAGVVSVTVSVAAVVVAVVESAGLVKTA